MNEIKITIGDVIKIEIKITDDTVQEHVLLYVDVQSQQAEAGAETRSIGGIVSIALSANAIQV